MSAWDMFERSHMLAMLRSENGPGVALANATRAKCRPELLSALADLAAAWPAYRERFGPRRVEADARLDEARDSLRRAEVEAAALGDEELAWIEAAVSKQSPSRHDGIGGRR